LIKGFSRCFLPQQQPIRRLAWQKISDVRTVGTDKDTTGGVVAQGGKEDALGALSGVKERREGGREEGT